MSIANKELLQVLKQAEIKLPVDIGIVGRFDEELLKREFTRVIIPTSYGLMDRAFYGQIKGQGVLVIYGRFDKKRGMSTNINFEKTQAAFNAVGVKKIIGTFVTGSVKNTHKIGDVFIPDDFISIGGNKNTLFSEGGFKNVDMFEPFCPNLRAGLTKASKKVSFPVKSKGTYVCFHGFPRIETKAELTFYQKMGWDIVGQTIDPEATLARESGCCYAAIAVTIDDLETRARFLAGDQTARDLIQNAIPNGRRKTTEIVFKYLDLINNKNISKCICSHKFHSEKSHFRYLPDYILDDLDYQSK